MASRGCHCLASEKISKSGFSMRKKAKVLGSICDVWNHGILDGEIIEIGSYPALFVQIS
jgi:hypothetical protein